MASEKITGLTELAAAPANTDWLEVVDISDTTMAPTGTNKKILVSNLFANSPTGSGTVNTMAMWTGTSTLGNSNFTQSGASLIPTTAGNLGSSSNKFTSLHVSTSIIGSTIDLDFVVNGSTRARIKSSGEFLINESSALAQFLVKGSGAGFGTSNTRMYGSSGSLLFDMRDNGDAGIGFGAAALSGSGISMYGAATTSNYIAGFYSGGVAAMIVRGHGTLGGSVGVGTNPPAADTRFHTKGFGNTSATWSFLAQNSTGSDVVSISDNRNLIIGGVTAGDGVNCLTIYNGIAPSGLVNTAQFYALAGEMYVKDSAGNQTQLSPHDSQGYWVYNSVNDVTKKGVKIHMEKLMKKISEIYGQEFFEEFTI